MHCEPTLIVIADDDSDDSLFLLAAVQSMGSELTVVIVSNGESLLQILESVSPQLIFLDINMPKKNGFEALKDIRSNKRLVQPTVIMCSTSNSANDLRTSQELGADMYVTKPNNIKSLIKMVEDIFKRDWAGTASDKISEKFLISHVNGDPHRPAASIHLH